MDNLVTKVQIEQVTQEIVTHLNTSRT